jgi:cytochrome c peroxidase
MKRLVTLAVAVSVFAGCSSPAEPPRPAAPSPQPGEIVHVVEGWTPEERSTFYHLATGSAYLPLSWLAALEADPQTGRTFVEDWQRFGLMTDPKGPGNPYGVPIGVTVSEALGTQMAGFNCAACHVGELRYRGVRMRVDGGPAMSNPFGFIKEMNESLQATAHDVKRLEQFWHRRSEWIRAQQPNPAPAAPSPAPSRQPLTLSTLAADVRMLKTTLDGMKTAPQVFASATTPFGFGRVDALGIGANLLFGTVPGNIHPADGATSFPQVWGIEKTAWLHWGANTNSIMERNIAQTLGTGGMFETSKFFSTVKLDRLHTVEALAYKLKAAKWPEHVLGAIDQPRAEEGRKLYDAKCGTCHETPLAVTSTGLRIDRLFSLEEIGTDPNAARNFERTIRLAAGKPPVPIAGAITTVLVGFKERYYESNKISPETQALWENRALRPPTPVPPRFRGPLSESESFEDTKGGKVYPARSLAGIWATPPYLHNGSVPTLDHLLRPAAARPKTFPVGQLEYDPIRMGYQIDGPLPPDVDRPPAIVFDTALSGNSNAGHEYGAELTDAERRAILEYLKILAPR